MFPVIYSYIFIKKKNVGGLGDKINHANVCSVLKCECITKITFLENSLNYDNWGIMCKNPFVYLLNKYLTSTYNLSELSTRDFTVKKK